MNKTAFYGFLAGILLSAFVVESSAQSHFVRFSAGKAYTGEYPPGGCKDIIRSFNSSYFCYLKHPFLLKVGFAFACLFFVDIRSVCFL